MLPGLDGHGHNLRRSGCVGITKRPAFAIAQSSLPYFSMEIFRAEYPTLRLKAHRDVPVNAFAEAASKRRAKKIEEKFIVIDGRVM